MMQQRQLSGILLLIAAALAIAAVQPPSQPIVLPPEQAAKEGRALVNEMLSQKPSQNTTNTGVMTIRDAKNNRTAIPITFTVQVTPTSWVSEYVAKTTNGVFDICVAHTDNEPNAYYSKSYYRVRGDSHLPGIPPSGPISGSDIQKPFAGSDFSLADLGLEFLRWPGQNLVKKEMKRSRSCKVLESINPQPAPGAYSRVVSWIDNESDGIVMAQAYDSQGKLLKEFIPKDFKKVNGQWQLEEMEIDNDQTGSSTRVNFNLSTPK